jgi:hypothetical protein
MIVELVDIDRDLLHGRVCFGYTGALVNDAAFDALNIGGNLVHCRRSLIHVACKLHTDTG